MSNLDRSRNTFQKIYKLEKIFKEKTYMCSWVNYCKCSEYALNKHCIVSAVLTDKTYSPFV